ncbi:hypothetical protein ECZU50_48020 [Escherichia coli]|nr:hypothetical protein ECZU50_48020 [Escherichia coli]
MKRHLNTSYRLVWNHITGTRWWPPARSRGKRAGVAVALSLAAVTSVRHWLLTRLYRREKP